MPRKWTKERHAKFAATMADKRAIKTTEIASFGNSPAEKPKQDRDWTWEEGFKASKRSPFRLRAEDAGDTITIRIPKAKINGEVLNLIFGLMEQLMQGEGRDH